MRPAARAEPPAGERAATRARFAPAVGWPGAAGTHAVAAAIVLLGFALRLREPLASPIIGAEDPYLRMSNVWDLVQGKGFSPHYPPGFSVLLAPFALLGAEAFYVVARFLPPVWGAIEVAGVYVLARAYLRPTSALVAALVVALMPENVFRTNLLFPTALDLAALPWLVLAILRASDGSRRALVWACAIGAVLLVTHPWVVALVVPVTALFAVGILAREPRRALVVFAAVVAAGLALLLVLAFLPGTWNPAPAFLQNAGPRLVELVRDPSSIAPLPVHVNLPVMLTWTAIALGLAGAACALVMRTRLALFALLWSAFILPFALVDWFDVWFIPHRSVAYLSVGVALLAALPFELAARLVRAPRLARAVGATAAIVAVAWLMLPAAAGVGPWYRLYDQADYDAWHAIADREPPLLVAASWQGAEGYRAITGEPAQFNPTFFRDGHVRDAMLRENPGIVVLVDSYGRESDLPRGFLDGWRVIGQWGDNKAYAR